MDVAPVHMCEGRNGRLEHRILEYMHVEEGVYCFFFVNILYEWFSISLKA
jgi:hypothetical protein